MAKGEGLTLMGAVKEAKDIMVKNVDKGANLGREAATMLLDLISALPSKASRVALVAFLAGCGIEVQGSLNCEDPATVCEGEPGYLGGAAGQAGSSPEGGAGGSFPNAGAGQGGTEVGKSGSSGAGNGGSKAGNGGKSGNGGSEAGQGGAGEGGSSGAGQAGANPEGGMGGAAGAAGEGGESGQGGAGQAGSNPEGGMGGAAGAAGEGGAGQAGAAGSPIENNQAIFSLPGPSVSGDCLKIGSFNPDGSLIPASSMNNFLDAKDCLSQVPFTIDWDKLPENAIICAVVSHGASNTLKIDFQGNAKGPADDKYKTNKTATLATPSSYADIAKACFEGTNGSLFYTPDADPSEDALVSVDNATPVVVRFEKK